MDEDLARLLRYELGDSPSIEKKAERLAQRFYERDNLASKNRTIYHQFSPAYWRSLTRGRMRTKIGSQRFYWNYKLELNAAYFVRSRRQGMLGYVLLPLP
jgi:hypothetical protein